MNIFCEKTAGVPSLKVLEVLEDMSRSAAFARGRAWALVLLFVPVLLYGCDSNPRTDSALVDSVEEVFLTTEDGVRLAATLYRPTGSAPAGVVLVHELGSSRRAWDPFARQAQRAGIMCLAFDMRGHGGSTRKAGQKISYRDFRRQDWLDVLKDIEAAKHRLLEEGANPDNLAVAGASIGANLVLRYAVGHADIQAVVLVSPGLDYRGIRTEKDMVALGKCPVLLITSEGDSYSAGSCATLKKEAQGFCDLRSYTGAAHGTDILVSAASTSGEVIMWLEGILGGGANSRDERRKLHKST